MGKRERAEINEPKRGDTDSENSDTEKSEIGEALMNVRSIKTVHTEKTGTEEESSVSDSLAEKQQSDSEFGMPVKLAVPNEGSH